MSVCKVLLHQIGFTFGTKKCQLQNIVNHLEDDTEELNANFTRHLFATVAGKHPFYFCLSPL